MKDKHAQTHTFIIHIDREPYFEARPICAEEQAKGPQKVPDIFDALRNDTDEEGYPLHYDIYYATPDFMDAIFALFVLVDQELLDVCSANEAAMKFTEVFYGFEVPKQ